MSYLYPMLILGIVESVRWLGKHRPAWATPQPPSRGAGGWVLVSVVILAFVGVTVGYATSDLLAPNAARMEVYQRASEHVPAGAVVVNINPPVYTYVTGRPSIAFPTGSLEDVQRVMARYGAEYAMVEDQYRPKELEGVYQGDLPAWLTLVQEGEGFKVYRLNP